MTKVTEKCKKKVGNTFEAQVTNERRSAVKKWVAAVFHIRRYRKPIACGIIRKKEKLF